VCSVHVCVYVWIFIFMHAYMHACIYAYIFTCMHVWKYENTVLAYISLPGMISPRKGAGVGSIYLCVTCIYTQIQTHRNSYQETNVHTIIWLRNQMFALSAHAEHESTQYTHAHPETTTNCMFTVHTTHSLRSRTAGLSAAVAPVPCHTFRRPFREKNRIQPGEVQLWRILFVVE